MIVDWYKLKYIKYQQIRLRHQYRKIRRMGLMISSWIRVRFLTTSAVCSHFSSWSYPCPALSSFLLSALAWMLHFGVPCSIAVLSVIGYSRLLGNTIFHGSKLLFNLISIFISMIHDVESEGYSIEFAMSYRCCKTAQSHWNRYIFSHFSLPSLNESMI